MDNTTVQIIDTLTPSENELRISTAVLGILVYGTGFLGNFLSFLLFVQKELRQVSTGLIFLLLNIFSTVHLLSLIIEFIDSIFQIQILPYDIFRCQVVLYLQNTSRTICSCLATTISIDRFLRSEYPIKSRIWCTTRNVMKLFIIYCSCSMVFYTFFFDPLNVSNSQQQCTYPYPGSFRIFVLHVLPPIRFVLICVIPVVLMVGCGGRMLYNIRQAKQRITQQAPALRGVVATIFTQPSKGSNVTEETRKQKANIDYMLLLMVITNIIVYIITQIPFNTYMLYYTYETSDDYTIYSLTRAFLLMWSSIYFGIGFYLYCVTSVQFRKQFITKIKTLVSCHWCPLLR